MATEELGVKLSVEGMAAFLAACAKMDAALDKTEDAFDDIEGGATSAGKATDQAGQAFDTNAARVNKLRLAMTQLDDVQEKLKTETNALARAQLEVKADKLKKEIEDLGKAAGDSAKQTKVMGLSLTDLKSGIDMAIGVARTFAAAMKAAFDFAQEGAAIIAVTGRFEALAGSAQNAATILDAVGAATGNTIDKMSAMQSASKLMGMGLADTSDEVAGLIRLAVKLGDQTQSAGDRVNDFALMLANQSVERLDNFGISSGRVRTRITELMNATEGLTREQAFLQATLQFGEESLDRLGDSANSTADDYAVLRAEIKNTTNEMKVAVAEGAAPLIKSLAEYATNARAATEATGGHARTVSGMIILTDDLTETVMEYEQAQIDSANAVAQTAMTYDEYIAASFAAIAATNDGTGALGDYDLQMRLAQKAALDTAYALDRTVQAVAATTQEVHLYRASLAGAIGTEMEAFKNKQGELVEKGEELRAKISELEKKRYLTAAQKEELVELRAQLGENKDAVEELAAKHEEATRRIILGFLEQRLSMDILTTEELLMLQSLAKEWGLMDEATYDAIVGIDTLAKSVEDGTKTVDEMGEEILNLTRWILAVPTKWTTTFNMVTVGSVPGMATPQRPEHTAYQHGGTLGNGSFMAGEHGPEMIRGIRGGGQVVSAPTTARMMGQSSVQNNNYNLTTNSMTRPGGLALEFSAMEMGSR